MNCKNCGTLLENNARFCSNCGAVIEAEVAPTVAPVSEPLNTPVTEKDIPEQYRPLKPWTYIWLQLLFAVPVVGLIFLIIFSIKSDNINRRNFARSYWCVLILTIALIITIAAASAGLVGSYLALY